MRARRSECDGLHGTYRPHSSSRPFGQPCKEGGKGQISCFPKKNIYIIYIDAKTHETGSVSTAYATKDQADKEIQKQDAHSDDGEVQAKLAIPPTYQQRLEDFKLAEKILRASRLPHQ